MPDFIDEAANVGPEAWRAICDLTFGSGWTIWMSTNPTCGRIVENGRVVHSFGPQDHFPPLEDEDA